MDDTIEICSGCGKMPRVIDNLQGQFTCTRCGGRVTTQVSAEDYEKVVTELDQKFHMTSQKQRIEAAASCPVELSVRKKASKKKPARKAPVKKTAAKKKPAKKGRKKR
ncbi:MAG: hypothetical protein V1827_06435 [Candidatus Micrarchaeota archaeon]